MQVNHMQAAASLSAAHLTREHSFLTLGHDEICHLIKASQDALRSTLFCAVGLLIANRRIFAE